MQKNKGLAFFYRISFLDSFVNKYCLWEIIELGYHVDILDLSMLLEPEFSSKITASTSNDSRFNMIYCRDFDEVEYYIRIHRRDTVFFPMFDYIYSVRKIFKLFSKYSVNYVYTNTLLSPLLYQYNNDKFIIDRERLSVSHLKAAFYHRVTRKVMPHKTASSVFFCGLNGEDFYFAEGACNKQTKRNYLYSFDYENIIQTEGYDNNNRYCLFIDQYIPYHPDNIIHKKLNVDAKIYYEELERILDAISKKTGLEIIVGAHPQANYKDKQWLSGYKIEYGKTASLAKNASLICTHFSTASIFAVMLNKPLLLIENDSIKGITPFYDSLNKIREVTGAQVIQKVEDVIENDIEKVNQDKYDKCMINNIAVESPDGSYLWARILDLVRE